MPSADVTLGLRNLYILPSRFGLLWLSVAGLLLLVANQTTSNSTRLLGFLMLGLMMLALFLTHDCLYGLRLRCGEPLPCFAGDVATYPVMLESRCARPPLRLRLQGNGLSVTDPLPVGVTTVGLLWQPQGRGWHHPPRLQISTQAPLGLFVCWSRWPLPRPQLIWPRRQPGVVLEQALARERSGLDEWQDLRPFREGERPAALDWRGAAKGRPLQAKVFGDPIEAELMLAPLPEMPLDQALEHLAARIWQMHQRGERYGLRLPASTLHPGAGVRHRDACLEALALA